ncbi:MAG: SMC-Scp complex subunit ScpB [Calditrichaeota bacterium]|nr:MAG: SMC-Scp complex subunit ScpB [Calditrichota bacterium]
MERALLKQAVEALIFASDVPLSEQKIAKIVEDLTPSQVSKLVDELNADYREQGRAFFITKVAGGFQFNTQKDVAPWVKKLYKGRLRPRLSQASLESLAIIAFKQPISRVEIDTIRGVNSGGVLKNLLERNLIAIAGRADAPGRPLLYGTTSEFLRYLGINHISELPKPREIEEIMGKMDASGEVTENIIEALTEIEAVEPSNGGTESDGATE